MKKGYWVGSIQVNDPDTYGKYIAAIGPILAEYGGKSLVRGGKYEAPEGPVGARNVITEFESFATALACYNSPAYQAALKFRQAAARAHFLIVEGVE